MSEDEREALTKGVSAMVFDKWCDWEIHEEVDKIIKEARAEMRKTRGPMK